MRDGLDAQEVRELRAVYAEDRGLSPLRGEGAGPPPGQVLPGRPVCEVPEGHEGGREGLRETTVKEAKRVELRDPVLIEGLPGMGSVGSIAAQYLVDRLPAEKFAELYSPHFPYYVVVDKEGGVRLLRGEFHLWESKGEKSDLILLTGDSQAQTLEGQYEVSGRILDFARDHGVKTIVTIGGYQAEAKETPAVVAVSTSRELLERALRAGASASPAGNPIVGTAGLLLGLAELRDIDALCLLGETRGYMPDPRAAKSVLGVLQRLLGIRVDLSGLDKEIGKSEEIAERMQRIEEQREAYAREMRKAEEGRITYIS